jgi:rhodanese-related sulfurtransferase
MERRDYLTALGGAVATGLAGCLGGDSDPSAGDGDTGTPATTPTPSPTATATPPPTATPAAVDTSYAPDDYGAVDVNGVGVPLVPLNDAIEWYRDESARFADARGREQYETAHIRGAAFSPVSRGGTVAPPVSEWPRDGRIVTYCGCPHHLSTIRARTLLDLGYTRVYALDEGFFAWKDAGYPLAGADVGRTPSLRVIRGRTDPADAGGFAWARQGENVEATPIGDDGSYALHVRFAVAADDLVTVETPSYAVEAPLAALTDGVVTGPGESGA